MERTARSVPSAGTLFPPAILRTAGRREGAAGDAAGVASLTWNPPDGEAIAVSAREIRYDFRAGTAQLSGAARAARDGGSLRGDKIFYNRKTGAMRAESDSAGGRVRAVFGAEDAADTP